MRWLGNEVNRIKKTPAKLTGVIIMETMALQKKQNQVVITTNNYSPGIYVVQLMVNGIMIEADKISIVK